MSDIHDQFSPIDGPLSLIPPLPLTVHLPLALTVTLAPLMTMPLEFMMIWLPPALRTIVGASICALAPALIRIGPFASSLIEAADSL